MGALLCCFKSHTQKRKGGNYSSANTDEDFEDIEHQLCMEDQYYRMEFMAMAESRVPKGKLTGREFIQLLMFLGYGGNDDRSKRLLEEINKDNTAYVTWEEYVSAMRHHQEVKEETNKFRVMFATYDDNNDGHAKECQIRQGLEDLGVEMDKEMLQKIHNMDENKDGKISYKEFIKDTLRNKGIIP